MYKKPTSKQTKRRYLILKIADYIIETHSTYRQTAKYFKIPKSTLWNYMYKYLKKISAPKWEEIRKISKENMEKGRVLGGINSHKIKEKK